MPAAASRAVLRQSRFLFRRAPVRHSSSTSEIASKAKDTASPAASEASQNISKVASSAGPAIASVTQTVGKALGKIGGRTGRVIAFVESLVPPTIYYSRVAFELARLVAQGQKMAPPSLSTFQTYFQPLINAIRNPSTLKNFYFSPQSILARVSNLDKRELAFVGVTAAEVIGFFTVGEMIGRFKIVGYRGEPVHEH
ncbi:hypothetical protein Egran_03554 [Elaphomyces granulatus]|uniref:Mitochondrial F1F0-ATP synthase g subunit n=1 Tax=Elaphomyces granulatus TaxID=519963 RepID=A0A232LX12_9EURO|nr:hypothetical protein Egran_03554 [Elaphomyces granulatus]